MAVQARSTAFRLAVQNRDNMTCQKCGRRNGVMHAHHIIPLDEGGSDKPDNGILLCSRCHVEWEGVYKVYAFTDWLKLPPAAELVAVFANTAVWEETISAAELRRRILYMRDHMRQMRASGATDGEPEYAADLTTPHGQFFASIIDGIAQLERDHVAERTRAAQAARAAMDGEGGGRLPYGYIRDSNGVLSVVDEQARIIHYIFTLRADNQTLRQIADCLNQRHYASPQGAHWHHSSVAAVLANAMYYRGGLRGASALRWPVILKDDTPLTAD